MTEWNEGVDAHGMRENLESWPAQIERSWTAGKEFGTQNPADPPRMLIWAGMGGSAIGGDFCSALTRSHASFPVHVHRGGPLPAWVGSEDRILLVSFSGNTAETLDTAGQAGAKGCGVDALTSGGRLAEWCGERGMTPMKVQGGRPPRTALGDLAVSCLGMMTGRGWISLSDADVDEAIKTARRLTQALGDAPDSPEHPLYELLEVLGERLPMVYGTGSFPAVARRWAGQFNENAKWPSHWGELPEMNHNEVVAYVPETPWAQRNALLFLVAPRSPKEDLLRVDVTLDLAKSVAWPGSAVRPEAGSPFAQVMELTILGDWLSYWHAIRRGVDPTPIAPIDALKAALG